MDKEFKCEFNIGEKVKLKPIETLKSYFNERRSTLSRNEFEKSFLQILEEKWFQPIEEQYNIIGNEIYTIESIQLHQYMDYCCVVVDKENNCRRYPDFWLERLI